MQILNWRREYEIQMMPETKTMKEYADMVMKIVNQIRLNGEKISDRSVVQKVLVSLLKKFEPKISSEDSRDLTQISLFELANALQAVEQRKSLRLENKPIKGALVVKEASRSQVIDGRKKQFFERKDKEKKEYRGNKYKGKRGSFFYSNCNKKGHTESYCWTRLGLQYKLCKQFGQVDNILKNKPVQAQLAENNE
ncbi:hypothetical protein SLEP1_g38294 [Rubroshorea leprosula]|uniref:Uncharacterized protein n=1 Tax=Rubroshorea leprosula TaxID=152421 RepID=A0AAV5KY03_9ROSI|nr:hypothetical protein SLEP1_g38294 [Rubroshorea leprosula]